MRCLFNSERVFSKVTPKDSILPCMSFRARRGELAHETERVMYSKFRILVGNVGKFSTKFSNISKAKVRLFHAAAAGIWVMGDMRGVAVPGGAAGSERHAPYILLLNLLQ